MGISRDTVIIFQCDAVDKIAVSIWNANKHIEDIFNELLKLSSKYCVDKILYELIKSNACNLTLKDIGLVKENTDKRYLIIVDGSDNRNIIKTNHMEVCIDFKADLKQNPQD